MQFSIEELIEKCEDVEFITVKDLTSDDIDKLLFEGFLPMYEKYFSSFLLKLHFIRAIIKPILVNPGKTVKRRSKLYRLSIDKDFDSVYYNVKKKFYNNCWFTEELYNRIKPLIRNNNSLTSFHTFEIWNQKDQLVAGDIGVVSGSRYLSMTGFYSENGSGTVLLYSIGKLLPKLGFTMWDLGMVLPYKNDLGAKKVSRDRFLELVKKTKNDKIILPQAIFYCEKLIKDLRNFL